jgi:flavin reductase (DIM6/NTAB) family NADH-FMN oxidoreductase RutF
MLVDQIKTVLRRMPYGFYAVTSKSDEDVNAMVANWISQVSFEPRLVGLGLHKSSFTHGIIKSGGVFAINIFTKDDSKKLMSYTKGRAKRPDKMAAAKYSDGPETGCPILDGAAAYLECAVSQIIDIGGDHDIVIGEPVGAGVIKEGDCSESLTLVDLGWSYAG